MIDRLLPPRSTAFELAFAASVGTRVAAVPVPLRQSQDPLAAPLGFLPFLAWGRATPLWDATWPEPLRRDIVAKTYGLRRAAGTLAGVKALVAYVPGASVVRAVRPPAGFFLSGRYDRTDARWRRWIASLPELRIYQRRESTGAKNHLGGPVGRRRSTKRRFLGSEAGQSTFFLGGNDPEIYAGVLIRRGQEERVSVHAVPDPRYGRTGTVLEIGYRTAGGLGARLGGRTVGRFLGGSPKAAGFRRVALISGASDGERWDMVAPTDRIQDLKPRTGHFPGRSPRGAFVGKTIGDRFIGAEVSARRQYWSLRLAETSGPKRPAASFLGQRMGMRPYTVELAIKLASTAGRGEAFVGRRSAGRCFLGSRYAKRELSAVCDAVTAGKALRDRALIDLDHVVRRARRAKTFADLRL
jgi:phage tail P2-like protein